MPRLTKQQKNDLLAKFAGGEKKKERSSLSDSDWDYWRFPGGSKIWCSSWSPATKPEHGDLVLRALVEKKPAAYAVEILLWNTGCMIRHRVDCETKKWASKQTWLWPAVCDAALEVIKQEGR